MLPVAAVEHCVFSGKNVATHGCFRPRGVALFERANEPKELHVIDIPGNYHADKIFSVAGDTIEPLMSDFLARYSPR